MRQGVRVDVERDWNWSDGFLPEVRRILLQNASLLFTVEVASAYQDLKQATDMVVSVSGRKTVAVRLRRMGYGYRDLTIRAARTSGAATELEKLRSGYGDIYLYGWTLERQIQEWMLVDLHRLRASELLSTRQKLTQNDDQQTGFVHIPYRTLAEHGCVLAGTVR